jgi:addiction module RelE/StbE family toxin
MTSKKPAASKRANLPRASDYTKDFLKDWQRLSHSGRYDMNRLKEAMTLLIANDGQKRLGRFRAQRDALRAVLVARKESRLAERGGERLRAIREENAATRQSP